jgi:hypothetical protein
MSSVFVVDQLTPSLLIIWGCGFVVLIFVYYWHWRRYLHLYVRRQTVTDLRSKGSPWRDSLLSAVQSDPEVDLLRRKARRYLLYSTVWLIALLPLVAVIYALALANGPSG